MLARHLTLDLAEHHRKHELPVVDFGRLVPTCPGKGDV
jgi:hypothetical protein